MALGIRHGNVSAGGAASYDAIAVNFDGSNDWLNRGADLTSNANSQKFTASLWFKRGTVSTAQWVYRSTGEGFSILFNSSTNTLSFVGKNTSSSDILVADSITAFSSTSVWYHVLISFDLSDGAKQHFYVDDVDDSSLFATFTNDTIDFTKAEHGIGSKEDGAGKLHADLADTWIDFGTYVDFSVQANRRKFINGAGKPVGLGSDGSTPTGTAPDMFFSDAVATWHTNDGAGGGFTENGALTAAISSPSD